MIDILYFIIVLAYISLALELSLAHVPSVASNFTISRSNNNITSVYSEKYQWIFHLHPALKILVFWLPLFGVYLVFLLPFLVMFGSTDFYFPQVFRGSESTVLLGIACIVIGRLITLKAVFTIRKKNAQTEHNYSLHTDSVFSRSRNPIQIGMYLFYAGIFISIPSVYLLIGLIYYIAYMHIKIAMEEDFLTNKYGSEYQLYLKNTRRYL
ncbi:methyltransferase [Agaribacter flavus]|uniref:Methyltransferase n=1 Tax=Agaribacter flavus TaxID=1902781 RepID=A0ABV7FM99_9ALTE